MENINAKLQRTWQENHRVAHFFELRIKELKESGHFRTAEIYLSSYRSFARFLTESSSLNNGKILGLSPSDIASSQIDAPLIKCYEQYLLQALGVIIEHTRFSPYFRIFAVLDS